MPGTPTRKKPTLSVEQLECTPIEMTPANGSAGFNWEHITEEEYEKQWRYRPVSLNGVYDHSQEFKVFKTKESKYKLIVLNLMFFALQMRLASK